MVVGWPMVLPRMMSNEYGGTRSTPSGLFRESRRRPRLARVPVLPDDPVGPGVDDHDPMVVIVIHEEVTVGKGKGE